MLQNLPSAAVVIGALRVKQKQTILPLPSLNSIMALSVLESASAMIQNNLILPQPSCKSTLIASSSSLNTCQSET